MRLIANLGLDPKDDRSSAIWPATLKEIESRGLTVSNFSMGKISEGATAVVFKAREERSGHIVAIKVYRDPGSVEVIDGHQIPINNYFLNECTSLADLQECEAVPRYHYGVNEDNSITQGKIQQFVVMEFVDGMTADKVSKGLEDEADRTERISELFRRAMLALKCFHDAGKVHRDISARNVMLQGDRFRFVDCARAKSIDEIHTGTHTVKGGHTPGYASEELIGERKTAAEDVSELCTIAYEWFTDSNKSESNQASFWHKRLLAKGADAGLTKIIVKGMTPRNPKRTFDPNVFQSASEVIAALDRLERGRRFRKSLLRNAIGLAAIAAVLLVFGYVAWERVQQFAYTSELRRLGEQREALSNSPREMRSDARVQKRMEAALELEQQAEAANRKGKSAEASSLLAQAVDKITDATRVAENLNKLQPLIEPLRKILLENDQWNRDCAEINARLTDLGTEYQDIQRQVESGDPDQAWTFFAAIQPKLVQLIDNNQQSYEIEDLINQLHAQTRGLDASLTELTAFEQIKGDSSRASQYYAIGKWREARTELLGAMASMKSFLAKHETEEQCKSRLASNAELVNAQLATNDALQREVADLTKQIADAKSDYQEVLFQGAQYRKERDAAKSKLDDLQTQLQTAKATLDEKLAEVTAATTERDSLAKWRQQQELLIADYKQRLERGAESWKEQDAELKRTKDLLARLTQSPSINPDAANRELDLAEAEHAIEQFEPASWEAANERLKNESQKYEQLLHNKSRERADGKTAGHVDVRAIDNQLDSQFRIVVTSLKKRDEQDQIAWQALESQITYQRKLHQATLEEGWAESSAKVSDIDTKIRLLASQQKSYERGLRRLVGGKYDFTDWDCLRTETYTIQALLDGIWILKANEISAHPKTNEQKLIANMMIEKQGHLKDFFGMFPYSEPWKIKAFVRRILESKKEHKRILTLMGTERAEEILQELGF